MAGNGYVPARNVLDALDRENSIKTIREELKTAKTELAAEKHYAREATRKPKGDNSAHKEAQSRVTAAQNKVDTLEKELERATGVSSSDRARLTLEGAGTGMAASYAGAGGTLLKGADMVSRAATDSDILAQRGQIAGQNHAARQNVSRPKGDNSANREARANTRQLQRELQELVAAKEAEAVANQLGLMKAASVLDAEAERLAQKSAEDIARAKLGTSDLEQFLIDTGVAGAQIAADAAANAVVPGSSIVLKGVRAFGDASQEARKAGANVGRQVAYGGLTAGKDIGIEKLFDGLGGAYGKGVLDKYKKMPPIKEGAEAFASTAVQPMIQSAYSGEINYNKSVLEDALRDAAIKGTVSGARSVWDDAWDQALNKTFDAAASPQTQAALRNTYVGTAQENAEGYAALIRALYSAKGDGHRW